MGVLGALRNGQILAGRSEGRISEKGKVTGKWRARFARNGTNTAAECRGYSVCLRVRVSFSLVAKGAHRRDIESPHPLEDAGGDFRLLVVGTEDHLQTGVEIVDIVQGDRFGGFGLDR